MINSKIGIDFAMLFTRREIRRTSDQVLLSAGSRDCGSKLQLHPKRLDSEALRHLQRWGKKNLSWAHTPGNDADLVR
jgi:hypothetical protein